MTVDSLAGLTGTITATQATTALAGTTSGTLAASSMLASGASAPRLLADRFSDTLNLLDYVLPTDSDATNGINSVIAHAQSLNRPVIIDVPAGSYQISGVITATLRGNQAIYLRGAGSAVTRIVQTVDADGIRVVIGNYGPSYFDGGAFNVTGLTLEMVAPNSTTKAALVISTTGVSGNTGKPLVLDEIEIISHTATSRWNIGIYIERFNNISYMSRISVIGGNIGISLNGTGTQYQASAYLRDYSALCDVGLNIGNWWQGLHIDNFNTINTAVSLQCTPTAGVCEELVISNSYLMGKVVMQPTAPAVLNSIRFTGCYFDPQAMQPGDRQVTIWDTGTVTMVANTFNGQTGVNTVGLYFGGGGFSDTLVVGNTFQNYGAPTPPSTTPNAGTAISIGAQYNNITFAENSFRACTSPVTDLGTGNCFFNNKIDGATYAYGLPTLAATVPARYYGAIEGHGGINLLGTTGLFSQAPAIIGGAWAPGTTTASQFAFTGLTVGWNITGGGGEVDLMLGRGNGAGGLNIYSVAPTGALDSTTPILSLSRTGNLSVQDFTLAGTSNMAGVWTSVSAPVTSSKGFLGSGATATVRYKKFGRSVYLNVKVSIPNVGSADGNIQVTLPFASTISSGFAGREGTTTGRGLNGITVDGGNILYTPFTPGSENPWAR